MCIRDRLYDVSDWLGLVVRSVDASLLDEWEQLQSPEDDVVAPVEPKEDETVDITRDERGFTTMVRNAVWQVVRHLAFKDYDRAAEALADANPDSEWSGARLSETLAPYWAEYDAIDIGPDARSAAQVQLERGADTWKLRQIILDPAGDRSWRMELSVDLGASREAAQPVLTLDSLGD